jgi:predicted transcriptional regulator
MKEVSLGELEIIVLNCIWTHPGKTVKEIHQICQKEKKIARTTVLTIIQRLESKGFLIRNDAERIATYRAAQEKEPVLKELAKNFISKMLGGSVKPAVQSFLAQDPSSSEIEEMEQLIEDYKKRARK